MKTPIKLTFVIVMITTLNSCALFQGGGMTVRNSNKRSGIVRIAQFTDKNTTLTWAHHDPTQRQTLMYVDSLGNIKVLAEQSPDAGISNITGIAGTANVFEELDAEAVLDFQAQLEKLTNRTSSLMITRENLYAIRELYFNNAINSTDILSMYKEYLDKLVEIVKEDSKIEEAKAKIIQLEIEKEKILLEKLKKEKPKDDSAEKTEDEEKKKTEKKKE